MAPLMKCASTRHAKANTVHASSIYCTMISIQSHTLFLHSFLFSMVAIYYINKISASAHTPTSNPVPQAQLKTKKNR